MSGYYSMDQRLWYCATCSLHFPKIYVLVTASNTGDPDPASDLTPSQYRCYECVRTAYLGGALPPGTIAYQLGQQPALSVPLEPT